MTWTDLLGYAASATVLATFCMNTMIPLRVTAILSNILFASFGFGAHIYPVMILHLILFPVNEANRILLRIAVTRSGIMVFMQNVASTVADAAYPSKSVHVMGHLV